MSSTPLTQARILVIKAAEDEKALQAAENSDAIVGFHAQQAVEKLMKALLSQLAVAYELTHSRERLEKVLNANDESLPPTPIALAELTDFAVVYRYELLFQVRPPDRAAVIKTVRLIREHIVARIAELSNQP
jgi:HEPN domain-containing protein